MPIVPQVSRAPGPAEDRSDRDPPGGRIVEHFRVDPGGRVLRALLAGALIITLGSMVIGTALLWSRFVDPTPARAAPGRGMLVGTPVTADGVPIEDPMLGYELLFGLGGLATIVVGGASVIIGLRRELRHEAYLALRTDGALHRDGGTCSLVRWDDVEAVRWDAARARLAFVAHDGSEWILEERFAGIDGEDLARRAGTIRRKALFGLL